MDSRSSLSIWQKIDILPGTVEGLIRTLAAAAWAPFRGSNTPKTFKRHMLLTLCRNIIGRLSPQQLQFIRGSTEANYIKWAKSEHLEPQIVTLPHSATKAFWIGSPDATHTLLYFHGGGWGMPGSAGHFTLVSGFVLAATAAGKSLAVLVLQYDLAPAQRYPHQLAQCLDLLRYVVTDLQKPPNQVLLGGDSAGGNMVFGILSHILHPHKAIEPLKLSTSIRAGFAASPVASFNTEFSNELQDPAPASTIKVWLQNYLGSGATDPWNEPVKTDVEWWNGVDKVVKELLITIADNEMMAADTKRFAATLEVAHSKFLLFSSPNDFHAEPAIGLDLGFEEGEAARLIKSWVIDRL